jgi:hypothetical protein
MTLLIGQSYAYASVSCESVSDVSSQHSNHMASMANSLVEHDMPQQKMVMDCCDQDCSCPTGTCSSVTLSHFTNIPAISLVSQSSGFYLFSIQDAFLTSLRKPPIIG